MQIFQDGEEDRRPLRLGKSHEHKSTSAGRANSAWRHVPGPRRKIHRTWPNRVDRRASPLGGAHGALVPAPDAWLCLPQE